MHFLEEPEISVSTQKMTVNWLPTFSGTVTVSVRTTGCGSPSDHTNVFIDVIPETIPSTTSSGVTPPEPLGKVLCNGNYHWPVVPVRFMKIQVLHNFLVLWRQGAFNNFASLNWEILDLPGGSIDETNPGVIYSNGVVDWNIGWGDLFKLELLLFLVTRQLELPVHQKSLQ